MSQITVHQLKQILDNNNSDNFIVLDLRTNTEHHSKRIPGVYNLPVDELENHLQMLKTYDKVYVHCQSGTRSHKGYQKLVSLGLTNVVDVTGDINAWEQNNFQLKTTKQMPIMQQVLAIAGGLVLMGSGLSIFQPYFVILSLLVSLGLLYAGLSGSCLMAKLLSQMPWNQVQVHPLPWAKTQ